MGAVIVVDAFWGDSGKGKIAAHLARRLGATYGARAGTGTNAGHSVYMEDGKLLKLNQLPAALVEKGSQVRVGSGVAVDPEIFLRELDEYDADFDLKRRTKVDYRCPIITPECREREAKDTDLAEKIGSTKSGTGFALSQFALRKAKQARELPELEGFTTDVAAELNEACDRGETVLIESSQGTWLSLALSPDYPYCTSDNCTAAASADDVGLNWKHIQEVVMLVKAVPSRVGEGPLPFEISREEIEERGIAEYGVTTGRPRRKASQISWPHLRYSAMLNGPTQIALTFCDHLDPDVVGVRDSKKLTKKVLELIERIEDECRVPVTLVETGKTLDCIVELQRR
jgi:adenylosuccinate synthase